MIKGLFLNRIHMNGNGMAVHQAAQFSIHVHPSAAFPPVSIFQDTALRTEEAFDYGRAAFMGFRLKIFAGLMAGEAAGAGRGGGSPVTCLGSGSNQIGSPVEDRRTRNCAGGRRCHPGGRKQEFTSGDHVFLPQ